MSHSLGKLFLKDLKYLIIIIILIFVLFHRFILFGEVLVGGDLINHYIPYKHIVVEQVKSGHFPFWNPYTFSGRPLYADVQVGVFYPPNWLFLLMPIPVCFTLLLILHLILGGIGMFYYAREFVQERISALISALIFILSGFFTVRIYTGVVLFIFTGVWTPLILLLLNRWLKTQNFKYIGWLAIAFAMQILAGSPQIAFYTIFCVLIFILLRGILGGKVVDVLSDDSNRFNRIKVLISPIIAMILAFLICAVQILPTYQFIKYSFDRAIGARWEYVIDGSLNIKGLMTYFVPFFFYYPMEEGIYWGVGLSFWELNNYLGILPLVFVGFYLIFKIVDGQWRTFFKRNEKITVNQFTIFVWIVIIFLSLALTFGGNSLLFRFFYLFIPGFNIFRDPVRIIFLYTIGVSLLTGFAIEYFITIARNLFPGKLKLHTPNPSQEGNIPDRRNRTTKLILLVICFFFVLVIGLLTPSKYADLMARVGFCDIFRISYEQLRDLKLPSDELIPVVMNTYYGITKSVMFVLIAIILIFLTLKKWISKNMFLALIILFMILDLGSFVGHFINLDKREKFDSEIYKNSEVVDFLTSLKNEGRFTYLDDMNYWTNDQNQMEIYPNRGVMYGLYDARGYDPITIRRYAEMMNVAAGFKPDNPPGGFLFLPSVKYPSLLSLLNVKHLLSYSDLSFSDFRLVKSFPFGLKIYENLKASGWAYLRNGIPMVPEGGQEIALGTLTSANYNSEECAVVPEICPYPINEKKGFMNQTATKNEIKVLKYSANEKFYEVSVNQPQLIVFSEIYYPGWKVYVDGERQKLLRVNHTLMGVYVPDGTCEVRLVFRPMIFYYGLSITLFGIIISIFIQIIFVRNGLKPFPTT